MVINRAADQRKLDEAQKELDEALAIKKKAKERKMRRRRGTLDPSGASSSKKKKVNDEKPIGTLADIWP